MLYLILLCLFLSFSCDSNSAAPECDDIVDCLGVCNGLAVLDECGICNGTGLIEGTCDCDGNILDECEVCNGPGLDCNDECEGAIIDCNGVCGGDSVLDCEGNCNGNAVIDECGVCNGDGIVDGTCDCDGNVEDCNDVCGGDSVLDCEGNCNGNAVIDECGVCNGPGLDCNGLCNTSGCVNMIEIEASSDTSLEILYNVDFNITGFQFDIVNIDDITDVSSTNPNVAGTFALYFLELSNSDGYRVIGANLVGSNIPAGCGLLINVTHENQDNTNAELVDIIFTEDIINAGFPNSPEICPN